MSSKDMCTISIVPELIEAGIDSFKIEGRMKSAYYAAVVTNSYRMAIDEYMRDMENYRFDENLLRELESVSHREYCTGFYLDDPLQNPQMSTINGYIREKAYFATALDKDELPLPEGLEAVNENGILAPFIQRNKIKLGDSAEMISPSKLGRAFTVTELYSENGEPIESAPHPSQKFFTRVPFEVLAGDIIRSGE
jgi:putative protease